MRRSKQSRAVGIGTANEKRCEDHLIAHGWWPTWRVRRTRFGNMDLFGLFDVAAVWQGKPGELTEMKFVQVKTNRVDKKTLDAIRALKVPEDCHKEVWVWIAKDSKWKIHLL